MCEQILSYERISIDTQARQAAHIDFEATPKVEFSQRIGCLWILVRLLVCKRKTPRR